MASNPTTSRPDFSRDETAERARKLWMERGSPGGRNLEHWLDAERLLRDEAAARGKRSGKDLNEAEKRLDGLVEQRPSPSSRTPSGERL